MFSGKKHDILLALKSFSYFEFKILCAYFLHSRISTRINYFINVKILKGEAGCFPTLKSVAENIHYFSGTAVMQTMWSGLESCNFGRMEVVS